MNTIKKQKIIKHSAEKLFELVCDIESYPEFVPGCIDATIQSQGDNWVEARLDVGKGKVRQYFVTRNQLHYPNRIDLNLVEGPLSSLKGHWIFESKKKDICCVHLTMTFSIQNLALKVLFTPILKKVVGGMVEAFCSRADVLYADK